MDSDKSKKKRILTTQSQKHWSATNAPSGNVLQLFTRDNEDIGMFYCVLPGCKNKSVKSTEGYKGLKQHIHRHHGLWLDSEVEKKSSTATPKRIKGQPTLQFRSVGASEEALKQAALEMIILDLEPFSVVDRPGFRRYNSVASNSQCPSAATIRRFLDSKFEKVVGCMKDFLVLPQSKYVAISWDGRKSVIQGKPMLDILVHGITKDFYVFSLPLCCREIGGKTDNEIKRFIVDILAGFKIHPDRIICAVGDEGEKTAALKLFCNYIPCAAHKLSTITRNGLIAAGLALKQNVKVNDESRRTVEWTQRCVRLVKGRYRLTNYFEEKREQLQNEKKEKVVNLVDFSPTRFCGSVLMGSHFLKNRDIISSIQSDAPERSKTESGWSDWPGQKINLQRMFFEWEDITRLLDPLVDALELFSGRKYCTVSSLIPVKWLLRFHINHELSVGSFKSQAAIPLANALLRGLDGSIEEDMGSPVVQCAVLLDVRFRLFKKVPKQESEEKQKHWKEMYRTIRAWTNEGRIISQSKTALKKFYLDKFKEFGIDSNIEDAEENFDDELATWEIMVFSNITTKQDPVKFWREQDVTKNGGWVRLKALAGIPASAVETERIWSKVARVLVKSRASLHLETAEKQVILQFLWSLSGEEAEGLPPGLLLPK